MGRFAFCAAVASLIVPVSARAANLTHPVCVDILPPAEVPTGQRALMPEDLVRLRDIGPVEPQYFPSPSFTLSPDGRWAAFQLRRGEPKANGYCLAMVILDLSLRVPAKVIDTGGEPILSTIDLREIAELPTGWLATSTPRWSPDGKWIVFLKRTDGTTQVWRAFADGSGSEPLTRSKSDVVDFRFASDRASIVYETLPGIEDQRRANAKEGLNGWHYDDRFAPWISKSPLPHVLVQRAIEVMDLATRAVRPATAEEMNLMNSRSLGFAVPAPASDTRGLDISGTNIFGLVEAGAFHVKRDNEPTVTCVAPTCTGAMHPWWLPGKTHVRFLRSEGWGNASTAVYDWNLKSGSVRRVYLTDDVLASCTPQARSLICLAYSSLVPGRLVRLDPDTGKRKTLFDLNPEFAHLTLGRPIRLHWRNAYGLETLGDLVLPVDYRRGQKYPMVVVQYDTRGFLRGGTGDEYPIQAFVNRGYAVLSFRRPQSLASIRGGRTGDEVGRINLEHFSDRRSVESSLEGGVRLAIERGIADRSRIGITGLSDGTSTVEWALIHNSLFSAAAVSSCCWDPAFEGHVGPAAARHFRAEGWPGVLEPNDPAWKEASLLENARRIATPILVNASDEELLSATLSYTGLREAGVPIDMFVYPGEYHGRWQPAHRLATFRRSLDWFDFWLRGIRSDAPDREIELKEWDRLKLEGGHGHPI